MQKKFNTKDKIDWGMTGKPQWKENYRINNHITKCIPSLAK